MEAKTFILTQEGYDAYEAELKERKTTKRAEIVEMIRVAKAQGDLSENAEYDAARDEQGKNEAEIRKLEEIIKNAQIVEETENDKDKVSIGCTVKILDMEYDDELEYRIVGSTEANLLEGKISNESPVGAALIGAKEGDEVVAVTDMGELKFKVLTITKNNSKKKK